MGFKQVESTPISLGGNPAHRIVYVYSIVKNGAEVNQGKSMENHHNKQFMAHFRRIQGFIKRLSKISSSSTENHRFISIYIVNKKNSK